MSSIKNQNADSPAYAGRPQLTIPHLAGWPFVGNYWQFKSDPLNLLLRVSRECGDIGTFDILGLSITMLNRSEFVEAILRRHDADCEKGPLLRRYATQLIGEGLFTCEQKSHRQQRKLLQPTLTRLRPFVRRNNGRLRRTT